MLRVIYLEKERLVWNIDYILCKFKVKFGFGMFEGVVGGGVYDFDLILDELILFC